MSTAVCPRCGSAQHVIRKLILIGKRSPDPEYAGPHRKDQLATNECDPKALGPQPLEQFINGFYCGACGTGFAPDELAIKNGRG